MRQLIGYALGAMLATPALGAGWISTLPTSSGGTSPVSCGTIIGTVGILTDWTHTRPGNKTARSDNGEVGAMWNGDRYPVCTPLPAPVTEDSLCRHVYTRSSGGTDVTISLTTNMQAVGSAQQSNPGDPSWWWAPTVNIHDSAPTVTLVRKDGSTTSVGWSTIPDPYDHVAAHGTGGAGGAPPAAGAPPGGTLTASFAADVGGAPSGQMDASTGSIGSSTQYKSLRVDYHVYSSANRDCDNVKVQNWKVYLRSTMVTSVP